jgi:hypothetical protein
VAQHRHKRDTNARRTPRAVQIAAPLAVVATLSAVSVGVLSATPTGPDETNLLASSSSNAVGTGTSDFLERRGVIVTRSQVRSAQRAGASAARKEARKRDRIQARAEARQAKRAVANAERTLWTTAELNLWTSADKDARKVGLLDAITKVLVTGRRENGRAEVVVKGQSRWVTAGYLSAEKPETGPSLGGVCSNGSSIDAGRASLYKIHDVVCANWPQITSYGTWRSDGEHGQGRAIDIMVSGPTGWDIANFLRANYSALGIEYIIYSQQMWSVERSAEGWRGMSDRGSVTANHYDHVHVTVY